MITEYYTIEERYQIANTIWLQLGSQRFSLVTGCKPVCYGEKDGKVFLLLSVGKNERGINLFEVACNEGVDLYEVSFMRKHGEETSVVAHQTGIYNDMLHTVFEQYSGMKVNFKVAA